MVSLFYLVCNRRHTSSKESRNIFDIFLVRLLCKNNHTPPRAFSSINPFVAHKLCNFLHDNFRFIRSVGWLLSANQLRSTRIYPKLISQNGAFCTLLNETVPEFNSNISNRCTSSRVDRLIKV